MSVADQVLDRPREHPATWEEYLALGEDVRAEYVDGKIIVSPSPTRRHQQLSHALVSALKGVLPADHDVAAAWAWKPGADEFIPDVVVFAATEEDVRLTATPVLAVEVLSTNRRDDLVRTVQKYARAGLPHYWITDPADGSFDAFELGEDGLYVPVVHLDGGEAAEVDLGVARLHLDVRAMLGS